MPTFGRSDSFKRDYKTLNPERREKFKATVALFVEDLMLAEEGKGDGGFRPSLRVKPMQDNPGVWEMTWDTNGRATFQYGDPIKSGKRHIEWRRLGGHDIFGAP